MAKIKNVKVNNTSLPIYFGWAAFSDFCDATGRNLHEIQELETEMKPSDAIQLLYAGLKHGHRKGKMQFDYTTDDVADLMDDHPDLLPEAMKIFGESFSQSSGSSEVGAVEKK